MGHKIRLAIFVEKVQVKLYITTKKVRNYQMVTFAPK